MNDSIEDAARAEIQAQAISSAEVACLLHTGVTVLYLIKNGCPLCRPGPDPDAIVKAMLALSTAPAPVAQVFEAVLAIEPFVRQLGGREIMAFGHTVGDVIRLGAASTGLKAWLDGVKK